MLGPALSLAVRQQEIVNRFQPRPQQPLSERRLNHFDASRNNRNTHHTASNQEPVVFFQAQQPKMDHLDFIATLLQKIHPTLYRFWQRQERDAIQRHINTGSTRRSWTA